MSREKLVKLLILKNLKSFSDFSLGIQSKPPYICPINYKQQHFNIHISTFNIMSTSSKKSAKKFYLGCRYNPQFLKPYYVAYGQLSKADAKMKEGTIYGSMTVTAFDTQEEYTAKMDQLHLEGYRISGYTPTCPENDPTVTAPEASPEIESTEAESTEATETETESTVNCSPLTQLGKNIRRTFRKHSLKVSVSFQDGVPMITLKAGDEQSFNDIKIKKGWAAAGEKVIFNLKEAVIKEITGEGYMVRLGNNRTVLAPFSACTAH